MSKSWNMFSKLAHSTNNLIQFAVHGKHPQRGSILATFVRLHVKMAFCALAQRPLRSFPVLGREMSFADPRTFSLLLMELFIEETYGAFGQPLATILDLGSNIGMSILLFKSLWPDCSVFGVEASPEIFALLQQNVRGLPNVTVINRAVSDHAGTISFYSTPGSLMGSTNSARGSGQRSEVQAVPISEFVTGPLDLLKIDIEGGEIDAFAELESSGKMALIQRMVIEYHHHIPGEWHSLAAFLDRLERHGFGYELAASLSEADGGMQDILIRAWRVGPIATSSTLD